MITPAALIDKFKYALNNGYGYIYGQAGDIWTAEKQKKSTREQTVLYGAQWIGKHVADCSGLFSWAFKQLGGYMYHGSNTMYNTYCTSKGSFKDGKRTDGKTLKPGTALFTGTSSNRGHVGLYIGDDWVIEAQGTKAGVVKSKSSLSKWTWWGELRGVDYSSTTPVTPSPTSTPTPVTTKQAMVTAPSGKTVKMRKEPTTYCRVYDDVPIGAIVTVVKAGPDWTQISYKTRKGWYMMSMYLKEI